MLNVVDALEMEESDDRDEELFNRFGGVLLTVEEEGEDEDEHEDADENEALLADGYVD